MPRTILLAALICLLVPATAWAQPARVFDVAGGKPERIIVRVPGVEVAETTESPADAAAMPESRMLGRLDGILAALQGAGGVQSLYACVAPGTPKSDEPGFTESIPGTVPLYVLECRRGTQSRRVEILQTAAGGLAAHAVDPDGRPTPLVPLRYDKFTDIAAAWLAYRGGFDPLDSGSAPAAGSVIEIEKPYHVGQVVLDGAAVSERFTRGLRTSLAPTARTLGDETMYIRIPRGYDPCSPAGLIVWVDPSPDGHPPRFLDRALDDLGLLCIGAANAGNNRPLVDRCQLALDAVATASARCHIDSRRVYITGVSGGGRVASIMLACFPNVFTGAVPIVGVSMYEKVPAGEPGQFYRPAYRKPDPSRFAQFRTRRMAPMSGPKDGNYIQTIESVKILVRDGVPARTFEYPDMGHEAPTPERFLEALRWVDEPYQAVRRREIEQAQRLLDEAMAGGPPKRAALIRITEVGPWTPAAWRAVELLRDSPASPSGAPRTRP